MNPLPPPGKRMPLSLARTYQIGDPSTTREDKSNECSLRGLDCPLESVTASPQPPIPPGLFGHEIVSGYFGSSLRSSGAFRGISPVRQRSSVVCNQGFYRIMEGATDADMRFVAAVAAASNGWSDGDGGGEERATKAGDAREKVEFDLLNVQKRRGDRISLRANILSSKISFLVCPNTGSLRFPA